MDAAWDCVSKKMHPLKASGGGVMAGAEVRGRAVEAVALGAAEDAVVAAEETRSDQTRSQPKLKPSCLKNKLPSCKNA
jgi:hypothetical protein